MTLAQLGLLLDAENPKRARGPEHGTGGDLMALAAMPVAG